MTPGPLAVNMATFIGASQAGLAGSFVATVGVVLSLFCYHPAHRGGAAQPDEVCRGQRLSGRGAPLRGGYDPATACTMGLSTLGGFTALSGGFAPDVRALAVFALLGILHFAYKKKTQKAPSPIGMILLSAVLGAVLWSI